MGIRVIGPENCIDVDPNMQIKISNYYSQYNVIRCMLGVAEGPEEVRKRNPFDIDMIDNNAISMEKIKAKYPTIVNYEENEKYILMSFLLMNNLQIGKNFKSIQIGDIFNIFQNIDNGFSENVIGEVIKGDDEVSIGEVISQQFNIGIGLMDIEKFNSKSFSLINIGNYETYMWKSQHSKNPINA